jgi:hypothetical protein
MNIGCNAMRYLLLITLYYLIFGSFCSAQQQSSHRNTFINPTGTYELQVKTKIKDDDTYGYFGEIKIKLLHSNRIAMSFYICKGAPSYNSGSFVDTLEYKNNVAVYSDRYDPEKGCTVTFSFSRNKINVVEKANYDFGTCWGHGVFAFGNYRKKSSKSPVIKDPLTD